MDELAGHCHGARPRIRAEVSDMDEDPGRSASGPAQSADPCRT